MILTEEDFYGSSLILLKQAQARLTNLLQDYGDQSGGMGSLYTIQNIKSRIKTPESMIRKLQSHNFPADAKSALTNVHDALGLRVICSFTSGVYRLAEFLERQPEYEVIQKKDYISYPKANGYRSLHLILKIHGEPLDGLFAEIQIRTIAQDFWGSLEHQIKYKQEVPHTELIRRELKRCADEIASIDLTMQTIQELILEEEKQQP